MLYGSIRRNLYAHLSIHKMRWTLVFDYLFTPISTPKWHESIWFCMKFYEFTISKNFVTMRFYGLLLRYIDLWKKANLQRYLISFFSISPLNVLIVRSFSAWIISYQNSFVHLLYTYPKNTRKHGLLSPPFSVIRPATHRKSLKTIIRISPWQ